MFPKLLDVPISTYLIVLAKIRRPSTTPSASTSRSFSSSSTSAASLATSVAESTEMPTSAACSATASLTPSPRKATSVPVRPLRPDDLGLVLGADPGEDRGPGEQVAEPVAGVVDVGAGGHLPGRQAEVGADLGRHGRVVAGEDLDRDAEAGQPLQRRAGVGLGRVEEDQEAAEGEVVLVGRGERGLARRLAGGHGDHPVAGRELAHPAPCGPRPGTSAHRSSSPSGAPLVMTMRLPRSSSARTETSAPFVVERQRGQPPVAGQRRPLPRGGRGVPQRDVERVAAGRPAVLGHRLVAQQPQQQRLVAGRAVRPGRSHEAEAALGQRAGLVGEQHVDVAEVLDAHQPLDQHLARGPAAAPRRPGWSRRSPAAAAARSRPRSPARTAARR